MKASFFSPSIRADLVRLCKASDIAFLGLFGSHARGDQHSKSDLDLLVDFKKTKSFFELSDIVENLESITNKKIDLVRRKTLKPDLKQSILQDLQTVYEEK